MGLMSESTALQPPRSVTWHGSSICNDLSKDRICGRWSILSMMATSLTSTTWQCGHTSACCGGCSTTPTVRPLCPCSFLAPLIRTPLPLAWHLLAAAAVGDASNAARWLGCCDILHHLFPSRAAPMKRCPCGVQVLLCVGGGPLWGAVAVLQAALAEHAQHAVPPAAPGGQGLQQGGPVWGQGSP